MTIPLVLLAGMLVVAGLLALVLSQVRTAPRLDLALDRIDAGGAGGRGRDARADLGSLGSRSERLGALLYRVLPVRLHDHQRRALRLQDKSIAEFYADKAVMAIVGAVLPGLFGFLLWYAGGTISAVPVAASLVGAVIGFFVPDLLLRRSGSAVRAGAVEALLMYIELVTLERLTNASATQALRSAAMFSEVPLFLQIRTALERARLEQQTPYAELRRLATDLNLPELADVADVMQLDETGAALSGSLRARVAELRNAHLTAEQIAASAAAEGMTIYMTLPALVFGLILIVAAVLRLALG